MFVTLLIVTFLISLAVSTIVVFSFRKPIESILRRILKDDISRAWGRYLYFAIYVVGISSGVRIFELEKYITPGMRGMNQPVPDLNQDRWILEVYRTVIDSLQGLAWLLLAFFLIALIAFVVIRVFEMVAESKDRTKEE